MKVCGTVHPNGPDGRRKAALGAAFFPLRVRPDKNSLRATHSPTHRERTPKAGCAAKEGFNPFGDKVGFWPLDGAEHGASGTDVLNSVDFARARAGGIRVHLGNGAAEVLEKEEKV